MKKTVPRLAVFFLLIIVIQNLVAQRGVAQRGMGVPPLVLRESHTGGTPVPRQERGALACSPTAFAAQKALPEIVYDCPEGVSESSDELLKTPVRLAALSKVTRELESFTGASWWNANVDELNACKLHGESGKLTSEERSKMRGGEFNYSLFGDRDVRLVLLTDPCFQVGYNGSVGFLLVKYGRRIYITKILEGYYSRIDNSVGLDSALVNGERIIEISTGNSMPPATTNYYYVIDPGTHKAVPKKLFKDGKTFTNEMSSALILGEPTELGLPRGSEDTVIMKNHRLLPKFAAYSEDYANEGSGRKLHRDVFRWNGRFYVVAH